MKKILLVTSFGVLLGLSSQANAGKLMFGQQDSIHFIANTTIPNPSGGRLFLGHLVTKYWFFFPCYIENRGLVLGVSENSNQYFPLPDEQQLNELKKSGHLPKDLPTPRLGVFECIFGFSLELLLLVPIVFRILESRSAKKNG